MDIENIILTELANQAATGYLWLDFDYPDPDGEIELDGTVDLKTIIDALESRLTEEKSEVWLAGATAAWDEAGTQVDQWALPRFLSLNLPKWVSEKNPHKKGKE